MVRSDKLSNFLYSKYFNIILINRDSLTPTREWPAVSEILEFRKKVRALVDDVIENRMKLDDGDEINY